MSLNDIVDVADLDCIYLSYDEPQKEEFWLKIKNMVPWAKRVDGVKGSDAAHKAAGAASDNLTSQVKTLVIRRHSFVGKQLTPSTDYVTAMVA